MNAYLDIFIYIYTLFIKIKRISVIEILYNIYIYMYSRINWRYQLKFIRYMSTPSLILSHLNRVKSLPNYSFCNITDACAQRLEQLVKQKTALLLGTQSIIDLLHLRVSVDSGGCSGFQYTMTIEPHNILQPTDIVQRHHLILSAIIVTDEQSINFLKGCTINYVSEIIKSGFMVTENHLAESACGCGSSFAVKNFGVNNK